MGEKMAKSNNRKFSSINVYLGSQNKVKVLKMKEVIVS